MKVLALFFVMEGICALPTGRPSVYVVAGRVREGQIIKLSCSLSQRSSDIDQITWSWTCGDEDLTNNSTATGGNTILSFTANRRHNDQLCYCKAEARNSLNETYSGISSSTSIEVFYTPSSSPKLNISKVTLNPGEEKTLGCVIDSLGNPQITWSWTCGTQSMSRRVQTRGLTSDIVISADPNLNEKLCYCSVDVTYRQRFQATSNTALITVFYDPADYPRISRTTINAGAESQIFLQCSISTSGNPPITWSWYCNDVIVTDGVRHLVKTTELSFVADVTDDRKECYCRARGSRSISGILYDKKSSRSYIRISGVPNQQLDIRHTGVSAAAFASILTILLIALVFCSGVIFVQHRRIPNELSLKSWFLEKLGKKSNQQSQCPETELTSDEHKYEDLRRDPISMVNESTPTYQNLQIKGKKCEI